MERLHDGPAPVSTGRDVSGAENSGPTGLMAGKRTLNGNNAAFDMKSLGKHIEAVSLVHIPFVCGFLNIPLGVIFGTWLPNDVTGGNGDVADKISDLLVFLDRAPEYTGSDTEGDHALPGQLHLTTSPEPLGRIAIQT